MAIGTSSVKTSNKRCGVKAGRAPDLSLKLTLDAQDYFIRAVYYISLYVNATWMSKKN